MRIIKDPISVSCVSGALLYNPNLINGSGMKIYRYNKEAAKIIKQIPRRIKSNTQ